MCVVLNKQFSGHLPSGVHRPSGVPTPVPSIFYSNHRITAKKIGKYQIPSYRAPPLFWRHRIPMFSKIFSASLQEKMCTYLTQSILPERPLGYIKRRKKTRYTLIEWINAALIFAELIFADWGLNLKVSWGTKFCGCLDSKHFATLIFADEQRL